MRTLHTLKGLSLLLAVLCVSFSLLVPTQAIADEPVYGTGIVVDGNPCDWDFENDFFSDMYIAGYDHNPVLSHLYLRYDCFTDILYALVIDVHNDGLTPDLSPGDAWIKIYNNGWTNNKLIDGFGEGNTTPRAFEWVYEVCGDPYTPLVGYEACGALGDGIYSYFEAHLNICGETSSTGMNSHDDAISVEIFCDLLEIDTPQLFILNQNYPNPFNPATVIGYSLTEPGSVELTVYDITGQLVTTLVDEHQAVGEHEATFNAAAYPSGVYFYRIMTATGTDSRKMVFLK
jgi:hypothetical protein